MADEVSTVKQTAGTSTNDSMSKARAEELERRRLNDLVGADEPLRAAGLEEREFFDAEWRAQAEDARQWVVHRNMAGVDYREISVRDWHRAGVSASQEPGYVRWDAGNDWRVPRAMLDFLTDEQFLQFILKDGRFEVVDR